MNLQLIIHSQPVRARFIPHNGYAKRPLTKMDQFAENLANELTVKQAAQAMGKDYAYGNALMQKLRKKMGSQAK